MWRSTAPPNPPAATHQGRPPLTLLIQIIPPVEELGEGHRAQPIRIDLVHDEGDDRVVHLGAQRKQRLADTLRGKHPSALLRREALQDAKHLHWVVDLLVLFAALPFAAALRAQLVLRCSLVCILPVPSARFRTSPAHLQRLPLWPNGRLALFGFAPVLGVPSGVLLLLATGRRDIELVRCRSCRCHEPDRVRRLATSPLCSVLGLCLVHISSRLHASLQRFDPRLTRVRLDGGQL